MDDAELNWHLDEASLGGFMSNYAPVPDHLRKKRKARVGAVGLSNENVADESEQGVEITGEETDGVLGDENTIASDSEDNIPLIKRK